MGDRNVVRIAISPAAKKVMDYWKREKGISKYRVASQVYEWFSRQPEQLQLAILGLSNEDKLDRATRAALAVLEGRQGEAVAELGPVADAVNQQFVQTAKEPEAGQEDQKSSKSG